ncbi:MAG: GNAT family N-acetyltransferase [Chloroflexota bacterium]
MDTLVTTPRGAIAIRPARPTDAQAYRSLRLEALRNHPEAFSADHAANEMNPPAYWEDRLRALGKDDMIYFAAHQAALVGMCGVYRGSSPKIQHSGLIWGAYVQPAWRGLHIAEHLIAACMEWGREQGIRVVKLAVVASNIPAIRCYTRCGFEVYGTEPQAIFYDGVMYDELLMARPTEIL